MTAMLLGLILALASALATNLSSLFKQRGAVLAPPIHVRHPLKSAADLFRSRWFAIGWAVSVMLATAAGALFGVSDVAVKYLTHANGPLLGLISASVTANRAAILGGILIFGESIGSGAIGITGRVLAFLLVIAGAAMIPAPLRLKPDRPNPGPNDPSDDGRGSHHGDSARMAASGSC